MSSLRNPFTIKYTRGDINDPEVDTNWQKREVSDTFLVGDVPSMWLGKLIGEKRSRWFLIGLILVGLILFSRLVYLQLYRGINYRTLAEDNRLRQDFLPASRGIIFDRFGVALVNNAAAYALFLNSSELKTHADQLPKVQSIFKSIGLTDQQIADLLAKQSYLPIVVKEELTYEESIKLIMDTQNVSSLTVQIDPERQYKADDALAHLLGYTSRITAEEKDQYLAQGYQLTEKIGRSGIEQAYQQQLRGIPGRREIEVDSMGREKKVYAEIPTQNGANLFLGLDEGLQNAIAQSLKKNVTNKAGAVIAVDPRNGQIRAFVSWPSFDSTALGMGMTSDQYQKLVNDPLNPLFNRAISGEFPSGSTVKIVIALAGLEKGVITAATQVLSTGGVWYDKWFFPDWKAGGHGLTNVVKALALSVNTFFYDLALENFDGHRGLGLANIREYLIKFGLGAKLGLEIAGEHSGFVPSADWKLQTKGEVWYPGDTMHLAIGQGDLLVTPLQVAMYTSAIANGGTLFKPQLVEKIINPTTGAVEQTQPQIIRDHLAQMSNLQIIQQGMRSCVIDGSGRGVSSLGAPIAAKTGTAQVSGNKSPEAWFTAYLPYDHPELVVTVLVENGGEGSVAAMPIARDAMDWYIKNRYKAPGTRN